MTQKILIQQYKFDTITSIEDDVAIEEPLEISIAYLQNNQLIFKIISITMRTPGQDEALAIGFLFTENIINTHHQIEKIETKGENKICVFIQGEFTFHLKTTQRNFYTTSSCGVCGKASIEAIYTIHHIPMYPHLFTVPISLLVRLPQLLALRQVAFESTGGIHASALFDGEGTILNVFEDVGRHNALDKLIGTHFLQKSFPLQKNILLLSGRASFELIQKAVMANIPIVCAIGAPSSLAIGLAQEMDITLIGFLKHNRCNIYCGQERIVN